MSVLRSTYRRAQWAAVVLPAVSLGGFEYVRHSLLQGRIGILAGNLITALLVALWGALYVGVLIRLVEGAHHDLAEARQQTAVLAERDRIARELHDGLSQSLFFMNVKLRDAAAVARGEDQELLEAIGQVQSAVDDAYGALRRSISDLRRHPALPADLGTAVAELVRDFEAQSGVKANLSLPRPVPILPARRQEHLLAILQEALTNVRKHARARQALVYIGRRGSDLVLAVEDDGCGLPGPSAGGHFGIPMMQERAALLGGTLALRAKSGGGTRVELSAPADEEAVRA